MFSKKIFQASDLQNGVLDDSISNNLYLHFPRLSSQEMFETVCPAEQLSLRKRYFIFYYIKIMTF